MGASIVLTLTGPDRVGIVEEVTQALLEVQGNVESSRMARLGGEFAVLMLVSMPADRFSELDGAFSKLVSDGYRVSTTETNARANEFADWLRYRVEVAGADHEGIVYEIARGLAQKGINIESAETTTASAPTTGQALFSMSALVLVPPQLAEAEWMGALAEAGADANVDIEACLAE
jgi:glycine cleavage system transcriptional repressor